MDGSAAIGLASEITITAKGLLILLFVGAILSAACFFALWRGLKAHLDDCSGHRATFHEADRRMEQRLTRVETHLDWLVRDAGHKPLPPAHDDHGGG